eukprot:TRINITY_DN17951_c0_g2_i4.p1 TRINITY_DN17951_c0_g2~~TRINITY_DN17951_c0_g2_i4.p1  ORF type:complete len:554 (-),score=85.12 TRINITY_DN17951_c0_g2_i4:358-2019(-)
MDASASARKVHPDCQDNASGCSPSEIVGVVRASLGEELAAIHRQLDLRYDLILKDLERSFCHGQQLSSSQAARFAWQKAGLLPEGKKLYDARHVVDMSSRKPPTEDNSSSPGHIEMHGAVGQFGPKRVMRSDKTSKLLSMQKSFAFERSAFSGVTPFVKSSWFEVFFAACIMLNTLTMAIDMQYRGVDYAYELGYQESMSAARQFPWARGFLDGLDVLFGILFTLEVVVKAVVMRIDFVKSPWNWMDAFVIVAWIVESSGALQLPNPMLLRVLRLVRVARMVKAIRTVQALDSLHLLLRSIAASMSVLLWALVVLLLIQTIVAMFLNMTLTPYIEDTDKDKAVRLQLFQRFGTFTRTMITMFEMTFGLGNFNTCRLLMENVSEWYGFVDVGYKATVGFAIVKVISAVFMHETFKCAEADVELRIIKKERTASLFKHDMEILFDAADGDNDGKLTSEEFADVLMDPIANKLLASMQLETADPGLLFRMIARSEKPYISCGELVDGVKRLRGSARSIDLVLLMHHVKELEFDIQELQRKAAFPASFATGADGGPA